MAKHLKVCRPAVCECGPKKSLLKTWEQYGVRLTSESVAHSLRWPCSEHTSPHTHTRELHVNCRAKPTPAVGFHLEAFRGGSMPLDVVAGTPVVGYEPAPLNTSLSTMVKTAVGVYELNVWISVSEKPSQTRSWVLTWAFRQSARVTLAWRPMCSRSLTPQR